MPIITKRPDYLILHVGTNDATSNTSGKIIEYLLMLKCNILKQLPNYRVTVSKPTVRIDHGKANLTLRNVNKHLGALNLECIENSNISAQHLGLKGLHLNSKGKGRLALNFLNQIQKFWKPVQHLNEILLPNNQSDEFEHKASGKLESSPSDTKIDKNTNGICELKQLRKQNPHRIIIGHLNINSVRNKFESLVRFSWQQSRYTYGIKDKNRWYFPWVAIFNWGFFKPFRLDRTTKGGGILLYIREDIPCRHIKQIILNKSFEAFFVKLNLRSEECLLGCSYNTHKENITSHLSNVSAALDKLCADYQNIILLGTSMLKLKKKIFLTSWVQITWKA